MKDPYSILGVGRDATDSEIKDAYRRLARKYHPDNYSDDNPLKELANEKMQEINAAYDEIQAERRAQQESGKRSSSGTGSSSDAFYTEVRRRIQASRFSEAMRMLNSINELDRVAEWHYLMAVCLMQKNRPNDAMRELELACSLDPTNEEYQKAKEMFNKRAEGYGSTYYEDRAGYRRSDADRACDCCTNLICLDCLCECMGGDLIRCI